MRYIVQSSNFAAMGGLWFHWDYNHRPLYMCRRVTNEQYIILNYIYYSMKLNKDSVKYAAMLLQYYLQL